MGILVGFMSFLAKHLERYYVFFFQTLWHRAISIVRAIGQFEKQGYSFNFATCFRVYIAKFN